MSKLIAFVLALASLIAPAASNETIKDNKPIEINAEDQMALAQTAMGEYFLCDTPEQKMQCAAVMWCCCWRSLQGTQAGFADTIVGVCRQPYQFHGYMYDKIPPQELMDMAEDVLIRFYRYLDGESLEDVGCVLPPDYLWFIGNGSVNIFRNSYQGGTVWDWHLDNPYKE